ncbi:MULTISPECIES: hypothetical protein [unclassified Gilliamella]|uniref:hypothetical protein n=1 Tax=unclassified Gilliamella TaxID=2685620 RepID=UPI0009C13B30|nr:hypothetical protein [Gilliamella apicola]
MMSNQLKMHKKISLANLYFNRFLAIRYGTAFFIFLNLYWAVFLISSMSFFSIMPIALLVLGVLASFEQIKLYRNHYNYLPYATLFYRSILFTFSALIIILYTPWYPLFFPFLKDTQVVLNTISAFLIGCVFIDFLMLKKLKKIQLNKDKHFQRIQAYQAIIN